MRTAPGETSSARNIDRSWQHLLLEAFRLLDESREAGEAPVVPAVDLIPPPRPQREERKRVAEPRREERERRPSGGLQRTLSQLSKVEGFLGACVVDSNSGLVLGTAGGGAAINLELAASGNSEVMRAKRKTMTALGIEDAIEDMLITLGRQYHLLRPLTQGDGLFLYLVLDKSANLAIARRSLVDLERDLAVWRRRRCEPALTALTGCKTDC